MPVVRSVSTLTSTEAGRDAVSSGRRCLIASTVAITLAPGWRCTFKMIAGVSSTQAASRSFSALATTRATSFISTGAPSFQDTTRFM